MYGAKHFVVVIEEIGRDALDKRARQRSHYTNRESSLFFAPDCGNGIVELSNSRKDTFDLMIKPCTVLRRREAPLHAIKESQSRIELQISDQPAYCRLRNVQQFR